MFQVGQKVRIVDGSEEFEGATGTLMSSTQIQYDMMILWWVKVHGDGMYEFAEEELEAIPDAQP